MWCLMPVSQWVGKWFKGKRRSAEIINHDSEHTGASIWWKQTNSRYCLRKKCHFHHFYDLVKREWWYRLYVHSLWYYFLHLLHKVYIIDCDLNTAARAILSSERNFKCYFFFFFLRKWRWCNPTCFLQWPEILEEELLP